MTTTGLALLLVAVLAEGTPADPPFLDRAVSGVELGDHESGKAFVARYGGSRYEPESDFPQFQYTNDTHTEVLELLVHYGGGPYDFMQFRIRRLMDAPSERATRVPVDQFTTGKGIRLGMSVSELIESLGEPHGRERQGEQVRLIYRCDTWDRCPTLGKVNMPEYEATYVFMENVLTAFVGGYPYP